MVWTCLKSCSMIRRATPTPAVARETTSTMQWIQMSCAHVRLGQLQSQRAAVMAALQPLRQAASLCWSSREAPVSCAVSAAGSRTLHARLAVPQAPACTESCARCAGSRLAEQDLAARGRPGWAHRPRAARSA